MTDKTAVNILGDDMPEDEHMWGSQAGGCMSGEGGVGG